MKFPNMCVGFLYFNNSQVLLVKKNKPIWMEGKYNGIGGKIEEGELANVAMRREFIEETGIDVEWEMYCILLDVNFQLTVYRSFTDTMPEFPEMNDVGEEIRMITIEELMLLRPLCLYNVPWFVLMGLDKSVCPAIIKSELKGVYDRP